MPQDPNYELNGVHLDRIRNRNELRVVKAMQKILPTVENYCGCSICLEDAYALTLNQLPSHYVQTGAIILRMQKPSDEEISQFQRPIFE